MFAGYDHQFPADGSHAYLALWHGVTPALVMSVVAGSAGSAVFVWQQRLGRAVVAPRGHAVGRPGYDAIVSGTDRLAVEVTGGSSAARCRSTSARSSS